MGQRANISDESLASKKKKVLYIHAACDTVYKGHSDKYWQSEPPAYI